MNRSSILPQSRATKFSINATNRFNELSLLEEKISESRILNEKLQKLFHSLKSNTHMKTLAHSSSSSLLSNKQKIQDKKMQEKLQMQVQHMKHLENLLLSETRKLKEEVNNRRKERVIYSNIFKKYEKDIKKWQFQYKESLLDSMATSDAQNSLREKIQKTKRRLEKEIKELTQIKEQKDLEKKASMQNDDSLKETMTGKNASANESYKHLVSQRQIQLKAKNLEQEFQKESKKIMFEALSAQVMKIAGTEDLYEAIKLLKSIDAKNEDIYDRYEKLEKENKKKQIKCHELELQLNEKSGTASTIETSKTISQSLQIHELQTLIDQEEKIMHSLEQKLSSSLDVNCRKLTTDQLIPFIERMMLSKQDQKIKEQIDLKNELSGRSYYTSNWQSTKTVKDTPRMNKKSKNVLEKKLEMVEKCKEVNDYLLTYTEINKFMLEQYMPKKL